MKYYDDYKATDKMIFDGYFDYLLQNVLYRFFEDKKCYLPIVLKEEIEKMYHQSYFGYIYKIMEIIISKIGKTLEII